MARGAGLLVFLVALALTGSALAQGKSYYQVLKENPNHKFMIEMVDSVALYRNMLQNPPPGTPAMTIFAPIDSAFFKMLKEFNLTPEQAKRQAPAILSSVLFNHVTARLMDKRAVDASTSIATMQQGQTLRVSRMRDPKDASKMQTWLQAVSTRARITRSNQFVTGLLGERRGVIHDVSEVLLPMWKSQLRKRLTPTA